MREKSAFQVVVVGTLPAILFWVFILHWFCNTSDYNYRTYFNNLDKPKVRSSKMAAPQKKPKGSKSRQGKKRRKTQ